MRDYTTEAVDLQPYNKKAIPVQARQATEPELVTVSWQDEPVTAAVGDWVVTDGTDEWTVVGDIFAETYVALDDGQYMKIAGVEAARIDEDFSVQSLEGEVRGAAGDWLVQGPAGERWIIAAETFAQNYEPVLALDAPADAGGIDLS